MEENLQRGTQEEQNTHTVVTSDFQTLEFDYKMNRRFSEHSDEDTLSDGAELGNEKWIDITEFAKKTYEDAKLKGEPHKATFEAQVDDIIDKNGAYTDFNGNKVYGSVKWDDMKLKVLYRVYDYKSNPKLNDTDFDGLWDNADSKPLDNKFKGTSTVEAGVMDVDFNNDFRWFFTNPNKYNDELAVMSLIMSILSDRRAISLNQVVGYNNMESYMTNIGFKDIKNKFKIKVDEKTNLNANVYIGHKEIDYYGNKKIVYGIFIGDLNNNVYRKLIANNNDEEIINYYENIAIDIIEYININKVNATNDICYWIAGKSVAGAVANIVSKHLIDDGNEIFCYTFGAPSNNVIGKGIYSSIKNIVNEDDIIPKLLKSNNSFSIYGEKYNGSIKYDYMMEYKDLFNKKNYKGDYLVTNYISNEYKDIRNNLEVGRFYDRLSKYLANGSKMYQDEFANTRGIGSQLDSCKDNILDAKSSKAYYILAKNLNGFDIENSNTNYDEYIILPKHEETKIYNKDLVLGDGSYENPYYTESGQLSINSIDKNDFWYMTSVDGAMNFEYQITNYNCNLMVSMPFGDIDYGKFTGIGNELIYKRIDILHGHNWYKLHFTKESNNYGYVDISLSQYQDILYTNKTCSWERDVDSVYPTGTLYSIINYISKEDAPLFVLMEKTNDNSMIKIREKIVNGTCDIIDVVNDVKDIYNVCTYIVAGAYTAGIPGALIGLGVGIIDNAFDIKGHITSTIRKIVRNTYSTESYINSLINNSEYHKQVSFVTDIHDTYAICNYGLIIREKDEGILEFFDPKPKDSSRWFGDIAYGQIGCKGVFE